MEEKEKEPIIKKNIDENKTLIILDYDKTITPDRYDNMPQSICGAWKSFFRLNTNENIQFIILTAAQNPQNHKHWELEEFFNEYTENSIYSVVNSWKHISQILVDLNILTNDKKYENLRNFSLIFKEDKIIELITIKINQLCNEITNGRHAQTIKDFFYERSNLRQNNGI